ncbi:hypothetical protein KY308_04125 [Candidatus Woesearchaeota archaeon]|nr:hypothetical protein [Candidatus Woesearchaeota archaeon]
MRINTRMDVNRQFVFDLGEDQITPDLKAKIIQLAGIATAEFVGSYGGENISRIILPESDNVNRKIEQLSLKIALHRKTWPDFVRKADYAFSKRPDGKLQIEDHDGRWVVYPIEGFQVGLTFESLDQCLDMLNVPATPEQIEEYMTDFHFEPWARNEIHYPKLRRNAA